MDYRTFCNDLTEYAENKKRLAKAKEDLEVILYDLCGVRGVSYDSVMVHGNPTQKALNWLKLEDKYNDKETEVKRYELAIKNVEIVKAKLPKELWLMLYDKFVKGMTYREIGKKYGWSGNGVWHYIKRECERYL